MLSGAEVLYSYSLDWVCRWSSATGAAFGLEVHKGIWLKYRIFGLVRFVPAPWLPFWFASDKSMLKAPWELPFDSRHPIDLPVIRLECTIDDELARISAYAGFLHHVIILDDSYEKYFSKLSKRVREKCRQANKRLSFSLHDSIPACDLTEIRMLLLREHCRLETPSPPLHYIQNLLYSGLVTLCIARENKRIVGFFVFSSENQVFHIKWMVMDRINASNFTSIGLWNYAINSAFSSNYKICSLGSTSQWGLSIFKERLGAKRALLQTCRIRIDGTAKMYDNSKATFYFNLVLRASLRLTTRLIIFTRNKTLYNKFSSLCWMYVSG